MHGEGWPGWPRTDGPKTSIQRDGCTFSIISHAQLALPSHRAIGFGFEFRPQWPSHAGGLGLKILIIAWRGRLNDCECGCIFMPTIHLPILDPNSGCSYRIPKARSSLFFAQQLTSSLAYQPGVAGPATLMVVLRFEPLRLPCCYLKSTQIAQRNVRYRRGAI